MKDDHTRSDLIGAAFGLLCFPTVLFAAEKADGLQSAAVFFSIVLVGAATLAGIVAAVLARTSLPNGLTAPLSARIGGRTGAITVLVGSGAIVAALTFHALGVLAPKGNPTPPYYGLMASALSALPAIFGASAGAMLTAPRQRIPKPTPAPEADSPAASTEKASRKRGLLPHILLFSSLCYLSPLVMLVFSKEEPLAEPVATETPAPPVSPPRFAYEIPEGFEQANPSRLRIVAEKELEGAIVNHGITLSPDDRMIFYCARGERGTAMIAKRLDDFENVAVSTVENPPRMMSWSPDSKRIFWVSGSGGDVFAVWDLAINRQIYLPIPRPSEFETGYPVWWDEEEVVLYSEVRTTCLSLDTLEVYPLAVSSKWTTDEEAYDLIRAAFPNTTAFPNLPPPETERFNPFAMTYMSSYLPRNPSYEELRYKTSTCLVLNDREKEYVRCFPQIELSQGSDLLVTGNGDKIVCVRSNRTTVCYLGLRDPAPPQVFSISIPNPEKNDPGSVASMTSFICSPLTNPLNGKVVGPDRRRIKGVARFFPMKENHARVWISQEIYPIQEGDILADSHMKYGRALVPSEGILGGDGWTPLAVISSPETQTVPTREEANAMRTEAEKKVVASNDAASQIENQLAGLSPDEKIRAFVRAHHEKASKKDLAGFVADYATRVDFFDQGLVDQTHIQKDQAEFYSGYSNIQETISGTIRIENLQGNRSRASYQIKLAVTKNDGKRQVKTVQVTLDLELLLGSPRIVRQRGEVISSQDIEATNNLKSPEEAIRNFVYAHLGRVNSLDEYANDYTDPLRVQNNLLSRDNFRKNHSEILSKMRDMRQEVVGPIQVKTRDRKTYQVVYELRVTGSDRTGRKEEANLVYVLDVQMTDRGLKIASQTGMSKEDALKLRRKP